jgi:hypothetical protein
LLTEFRQKVSGILLQPFHAAAASGALVLEAPGQAVEG